MSDKDTVPQDATNPDEEVELEEDLQDTEDVEVLKEQAAKKDAFARQALARAKKAEAELKALKGKEKTAEATQTTSNTSISAEDIDTKILKAQGVADEDIAYLKKIAAVNGGSIIDAQSDDLYLAHKAKKEADQKADKARLGASRGSGSQRKEKTLNSPDLTEEEHKALWKQQNGR